MPYSEQPLGDRALFLLPSLKLKGRTADGDAVEEKVHRFLMQEFGGYTAAAGNIFGYWRDRAGKEFYGEHRQFTVSLPGGAKTGVLKEFLAQIAVELGEQSIYLELGGEGSLISPAGA